MLDLFAEPGETAAGKTAGPRISTAFAIALAAHVVLFTVLVIAHPTASSSAFRESGTIRQAVAEIAKEAIPPNSTTAGTARAALEAAAQAIGRAVRFPDEADMKKKVEIAKAMLLSAFRASSLKEGSYLNLKRFTIQEIQEKIEAGELRLPQGEKAFAEKSLEDGHKLEIHTLSRDDEVELSRLSKRKGGKSGSGDSRDVPPEAHFIAPEIFYRECPYEQILARGPGLFSVVQGFPEFAPEVEETKAPAASVRTAAKNRSSDSLLMTLLLMRGESSAADAPSALPSSADAFDPERTAERLETWMAKSEIEQFAEFKKEYLDRFPPDSAPLAEFTGRFIAANLNGVFFTADPFAEAFDSLEELYYKRPIYDAYLSYARRHPKTITAAEFLFSLAAAYDFERRTLRLLAGIEAEASEILTSWAQKPGVYDDKVKAYVLKTFVGQMQAALKKNGFLNVDEALTAYRNACLAIYRHLAERGGEIRDRAFYSIGALNWEDGRIDRAFEAWRRIRPNYETPEFSYIRNYLYSTGRELALACDNITKFLGRQAGNANQLLLRRQLRFHKWRIRAAAWAGPKRGSAGPAAK